MGWTEHYIFDKLSHKEHREHLDELYTFENEECCYNVLYSTLVNDVYYAAVEYIDKIADSREVYAAVTLTYQRKKGSCYWLGYKDMNENMGVTSEGCPSKILKYLTPTTNENAIEWRKAVAGQSNVINVSRLPVGSKITFKCKYDLSGISKGEIVTLEKRFYSMNLNTGRKKYIWFDGVYKWPVKLINDVAEDLKIDGVA